MAQSANKKQEQAARDYTFTMTAAAKARGWDAAFGLGMIRLHAPCGRGTIADPASEEGVLSTKEGQFGRSERASASLTQQRFASRCSTARPGSLTL